MDINFIRVSPTGYVRSTQPLTYDEKLEDDLSEASTFNDADLRHWSVLNAVYRRLSRQGMLTSHTEIEQN